MTPQIYLVRHGQTEWSLSGRHTGRTDLPLTGEGERRAGALRALLEPIVFDAVYMSPLRRAVRTCELAGLRDRAVADPNLEEWDYGDFEGRTTADIQAAAPGWNVFRDGCPGGETAAQVCARADAVLGALRKLEGNIILFSHGQFLRALAMRWLDLPIEESRHLALDTATLSLLGSDPHDASVPLLALWNAGPNGPGSVQTR